MYADLWKESKLQMAQNASDHSGWLFSLEGWVSQSQVRQGAGRYLH